MADAINSLPPELLAKFLSFLRRKPDGEIVVVDDRKFVDFVYEHRDEYPFLGGLLKLNEAAIEEYFERTGKVPAGIKGIRKTTEEGSNVTKFEVFWGEDTEPSEDE